MVNKITVCTLAILLPFLADTVLGDEADSGQLLIAGKPVAMSELLYDVQVEGFVAKVDVRQSFSATENVASEALYNFQIPDEGTIQSMSVSFADRVITAVLKERAEAQAIYNHAKSEGRTAAITDRVRTNLFSQRIANIPAGEPIVVHLSYTVEVDYNAGRFTLHLPFRPVDRYRMKQAIRPAAEFSGKELSGWATSPIAAENISQQGTKVNALINIEAGLPIEQVYSSVPVQKLVEGSKVTISYENNAREADGLLLEWLPKAAETPTGALFSETVDNQSYSLLMLMPPEKPQHFAARDISFVLDISGSMQGPAIRQAKLALIEALERLAPEDRFQIITFNNDVGSFSERFLSAQKPNITRAIQWVERVEANGGTEMLKPFHYLQTKLMPNGRLQQVVFITDGAINQEQLLLKAVADLSTKARIYTVAIGDAPNAGFMRKVATWGRGSNVHIASAASVSVETGRLLKQLGRVAMTDIEITGDFEVYPSHISDLHAGEPLVVMLKGGEEGKLALSGRYADQVWEQELNAIASTDDKSGISALWAMKKIASLQDDLLAGSADSKTKDEIIKTSLEHSVISQFTSFVAVQGALSTGSDLSTNELQEFEYPVTGLDIDRQLLLGFLAMLGIALQLRNKRKIV